MQLRRHKTGTLLMAFVVFYFALLPNAHAHNEGIIVDFFLILLVGAIVKVEILFTIVAACYEYRDTSTVRWKVVIQKALCPGTWFALGHGISIVVGTIAILPILSQDNDDSSVQFFYYLAGLWLLSSCFWTWLFVQKIKPLNK